MMAITFADAAFEVGVFSMSISNVIVRMKGGFWSCHELDVPLAEPLFCGDILGTFCLRMVFSRGQSPLCLI